jgi:hypothetical protein
MLLACPFHFLIRWLEEIVESGPKVAGRLFQSNVAQAREVCVGNDILQFPAASFVQTHLIVVVKRQ